MVIKKLDKASDWTESVLQTARQPKPTNMASIAIKTVLLSFLIVTTCLLLVRVERHQNLINLKWRSSLSRYSHHLMQEDPLFDYNDDSDDEQDTTDEYTSWGEWSRWSRCSSRKYCQEGSQHRKRECVMKSDGGYCTGVSMESRDCPESSCVRDNHRTPGLADESPAAETSFIGQECNSSTKYYARGEGGQNIPHGIFDLYPSAKRLLKSGFFAVRYIPKVLAKEENITKVCFEPLGLWNLRSIRKALNLNRYTKASLTNLNSNHLIGIAIGLKNDGSLYGVNVATGTPGAMYSTVYYRRFRGTSFHEHYLAF